METPSTSAGDEWARPRAYACVCMHRVRVQVPLSSPGHVGAISRVHYEWDITRISRPERRCSRSLRTRVDYRQMMHLSARCMRVYTVHRGRRARRADDRNRCTDLTSIPDRAQSFFYFHLSSSSRRVVRALSSIPSLFLEDFFSLTVPPLATVAAAIFTPFCVAHEVFVCCRSATHAKQQWLTIYLLFSYSCPPPPPPRRPDVKSQRTQKCCPR